MKRTSWQAAVAAPAVLVAAAVLLAGCFEPLGSDPDGGTAGVSLTWGVVAVDTGPEFAAAISAIEDYLADTTPHTVTIQAFSEYGDIADAFAGDDPSIQMGSLPTFTYLVAEVESNVELTLAGVRFGSTTYGSQFIARADSGITSIADLGGVSLMRPDPLSTSGWIIPEITLKAEGIDMSSLTIVDGDGHDSVVRAVYDGSYDDGSGPVTVEAGATFVDARSQVEGDLDYPNVNDTVTVIGTSVDIPNDGMAFHPSVEQSVRDDIVDSILAGFDGDLADELERMTSWTGAEREDPAFYDDFRQLLEDAGVSAADYVN